METECGPVESMSPADAAVVVAVVDVKESITGERAKVATSQKIPFQPSS